MTQPDEPTKQGVDPTAPYSASPYAPPAGYEPPAYGQPAFGEAAPAPTYTEPAAAYGQPTPYGQPAAPYGPPAAYGQNEYGPPPAYGQNEYGQPAAYAQPVPYGQPGQPYGGYPYPVAEPTNGLAIASLVVSILGAVGLCAYGLGGYLGIVGAILGHVAGRQIRERGGQGAGMAKAGVIVGWIATAIAVLATIAIVIFVVWAANQPPSTFE